MQDFMQVQGSAHQKRYTDVAAVPRCACSTRRPTCITTTSAISTWSAHRQKFGATRTNRSRPESDDCLAGGTRPRAASPEADKAVEIESTDPSKERAEHVMLIDLARNDIGRIAKTGSVKSHRSLAVERYSHVMHIVSTLKARCWTA
jgi:hypothetical protein